MNFGNHAILFANLIDLPDLGLMIVDRPSDLMSVDTAPLENAVQTLMAAAAQDAGLNQDPNDAPALGNPPAVAPQGNPDPLNAAGDNSAQEGLVPPDALGDAGRHEVAGGAR